MVQNFLFLGILAINTYNGNKRAFFINPRGGFDQIDFEFGIDTEVDSSCSLQWQNHYYVFGGRNDRRQVSMLNGNRLERKAKLDFYFEDGGCTVLNQLTIVLCFGDHNQKKTCRMSNNPRRKFTELRNSNHNHRSIRIASFDGKNNLSRN